LTGCIIDIVRIRMRIPPPSLFKLALFAAASTTAPAILHAQASDNAASGDALVRKWVSPQAPADVRVGPESLVTVRCDVDAQGKVTTANVLDSTDPRLNGAAVAALRQWQFSPALEEGKPIAECLDVPLMFDPADPHSLLPPLSPKAAPTTPPDIQQQADADYPDELRPRNITGSVWFECHVDRSGHLVRWNITGATDAAFVFPAVTTLHQWEFSPAQQGDLPAAGDIGAELDFHNNQATPREVLAANGITAPNGQPPPLVPSLRSAAAPVAPYTSTLANQPGEADVDFVINEHGYPSAIHVVHASSPEFGSALAAAVQAWQFDPAGGSNGAEAVPLRAHWTWTADSKIGALLTAIQQGKIGAPKGLDHPLRPIYRRRPEYPQGAKGAGSALIEAVICRDGRVRLVRIVSASSEAFGWSAAQAFSQWVFEQPSRGGAPADIRVRLPIQFPGPT
jgi:TonB family protein